MSNYLTRLAQRSLGETPAIRPRLPSLFAPLDTAWEPAQSVDAALETTISDAAPRSTQASSSLPPHNSAPRREISNHSDPSTLAVRAQHPPREGTGPATAAGKLSAVRRDAESSGAKANTARAVSEAPPSIVETAPSSARRLHKSSEPPRQEAAPPAGQRSPLLPRRETQSGAPRSSVIADAALADKDRSRPQTAVHITIGRVEVRTDMAAPPPAPRPRPERKPGLSLGDYLKRGGGNP